ncbi:MAG: type IV secretory system conjugative DNA transfer family protein [Treponema sp.]|uniref:type IV secretory system conjugative DNA transfer family protein n=1 Tax=Treponema sp. TaxID=166 RepID=UPI0025D541D3|nr:type IV secretory system conjugative DNA transfer family protein [Treponema sp.]MBQ8680107.1 type IV secretory system conjugative DNA transfer family protein [Treponema sp.]
MKQDNEFLRKRPALRNRKVLYDLSNLLIPVVIAFVGIIVSTQTFARMVGYNPMYTDLPFFVTGRKFLFIDEGYPFFNPGLVFLNILAKGLTDSVIQSVILQSLFPLVLCAAISVVTFFVISGIRGYGLNKNDRLYGTARWGTEKDVKDFGLSEEYGVVLAEFQRAKVRAKVNPKDGSVQLRLIREADLICLAGNTNVLMIAPTRSGKGVGSVIPTSLNFPWSVIFFDPKGELFNITSGFRSQFSTVLKFAPKNPDGVTVCFNPLEEVHLDKRIVSDVDLVIQNLFEEAKGGENSNAQFFNENAKDMIKTTILHVLTADNPDYEEKKNLPGVFEIMSLAAKPSETDAAQSAAQGEQQKAGPGDRLFSEMFETVHLLDGEEAPWLQTLIEAGAGRMLQMNPKVRSDVFSTVFSKLQLFSDPLIAHATGHSDFRLDDFVTSDVPLSLYLVVPFAHVDVIAPVFKLLINFMLRRFSDGETSYGEVKLKNRLLFMLDEFPVLGNFPFLVKTMGILAGYGINFFLICQGLNQLVDIYGQNHPFLDHCKTLCVYAPGKVEDAKVFTEAIGKESVTKESLSASGSRYAVALNNLNASSQEVARDLMNPDELMHLPPNECLVINQNMCTYIAKKVVYYDDPRFKYKAYSLREVKDWLRLKFFFVPVFSFSVGKKEIQIGYPVIRPTIYEDEEKSTEEKKVWRYRQSGNCRRGWIVPFTRRKRAMLTGIEPLNSREMLEAEFMSLPSNAGRDLKSERKEADVAKGEEEKTTRANEDAKFDLEAYLESCAELEDVSPYQGATDDEEVPPTVVPLTLDSFA